MRTSTRPSPEKASGPRIIDLRAWRYLSAAMLVSLFLVVTVIPVAMLVFTSLQPFYDGVKRRRVGTRCRWTIIACCSGRARSAIRSSNTLILGAATATIRGAVYRAVRLARGAARAGRGDARPSRDAAAGVSGDHSQRRLPRCVREHAAAALRHAASPSSSRRRCAICRMACATRYTGALQIHPDLEGAATIAGASRAACCSGAS